MSTMTDRDRHLATLLFQKPDRIPFTPGHARKSTLQAWHRQGLPPDVSFPSFLHYCRLLAQATGWL